MTGDLPSRLRAAPGVARLTVAVLSWWALAEAARAQPGPGPSRAATEPYLHVGATVHKLLVQGVEGDGTLWLDMDGQPLRVRLEDVELAGAQTAAGREARRLLGGSVGRWIRFTFHGGGDQLATLAHAVPGDFADVSPEDDQPAHDARRRRVIPVYAPIVDRLLESGLARYCPGPGKVSSGLARIEQSARARGLGIWQSPQESPPCPVAPR